MSKETIPNADLIRAALDGKVVQSSVGPTDQWKTFADTRTAIHALSSIKPWRFRLRPEAVVMYAVVRPSLSDGAGLAECDSREEAAEYARKYGGKVLRLELDSDTLAVISATTEAP